MTSTWVAEASRPVAPAVKTGSRGSEWRLTLASARRALEQAG